MGLYNFINAHPGMEEDIYHIPINTHNDIGEDNSGDTLKFSST